MDKKIKIYNNRYYLGAKKVAHIVWNFNNPDNQWQKGYVIHHKDGNSFNDCIYNLELMTISEHRKLHTKGDKNPNYGLSMSKEQKQVISRANKGKKRTIELKEWFSKTRKGHFVSGETKKKIGLAHKGKIVSDETKHKISEKAKTRLSDKTKHPNYGKPHSEETKKKMSESQKGNKSYWYGRKHSIESIQKMSLAKSGKIMNKIQGG